MKILAHQAEETLNIEALTSKPASSSDASTSKLSGPSNSQVDLNPKTYASQAALTIQASESEVVPISRMLVLDSTLDLEMSAGSYQPMNLDLPLSSTGSFIPPDFDLSLSGILLDNNSQQDYGFPFSGTEREMGYGQGHYPWQSSSPPLPHPDNIFSQNESLPLVSLDTIFSQVMNTEDDEIGIGGSGMNDEGEQSDEGEKRENSKEESDLTTSEDESLKEDGKNERQGSSGESEVEEDSGNEDFGTTSVSF